jgi:hypothetical protein
MQHEWIKQGYLEGDSNYILKAGDLWDNPK